ncbi:Fic family protein [Tamlana sp. I1]|uniref:Fic family protein n=1 Tax=Tamlana sp. I1 TaxID=2762061 RepID=UPI00188E5AE5|nr:Fic family protein [Tamlana sp. I1]
MQYNWQHKNWPNFIYDTSGIEEIVLNFALETGEVKGLIEGLTEESQQEAILQFMIDEAIKTSEIEGEFHSRQDVMSSIKKRLGIHSISDNIRDVTAKGIAELMVEVRENYATPLSENLIKNWHDILFANDRFIKNGTYRTGSDPMVIVSGSYGKEIVHYEAPPSNKVPSEMKQFVQWYDTYTIHENNVKDSLIKTAIAHLYFESIHPFEDGNGRIGRAIAEKCLSESLGRPLILSISTSIEKDKSAYYNALKTAQKSLDVSEWIYYFLQIILNAQKQTKTTIGFTLEKVKFLDRINPKLNERQQKVITKMLDSGIEGFKGGMTAKKYMSITKTSKATATRDLQDLIEKQALIVSGSGRNVHYNLNITY